MGRAVATSSEGAGDVLFHVLAAWKGIAAGVDSVKVFSAPLEGCTFRFQENAVYLVYALDGKGYFYDLPDELVTDLCSRTTSATAARKDFRSLGRPLWHTEAAEEFLRGKHRSP